MKNKITILRVFIFLLIVGGSLAWFLQLQPDWGRAKWGMSLEQVRNIYPGGQITRINDIQDEFCNTEVNKNRFGNVIKYQIYTDLSGRIFSTSNNNKLLFTTDLCFDNNLNLYHVVIRKDHILFEDVLNNLIQLYGKPIWSEDGLSIHKASFYVWPSTIIEFTNLYKYISVYKGHYKKKYEPEIGPS